MVEEKKGRREDKKDSQDEKEQFGFIKRDIREVSDEYDVNTDLGDFDQISNGHGYGGKYINENGHIVSSLGKKRNHFYDAKALDGVVYFENKRTKKSIDIYFVCKYTYAEKGGGMQDDIPLEMGRTIENFKKNKENKIGIFFLEGPYWKPSIIEEGRFDNEKTFHATRDNLKEILIRILKFNDIIDV